MWYGQIDLQKDFLSTTFLSKNSENIEKINQYIIKIVPNVQMVYWSEIFDIVPKFYENWQVDHEANTLIKKIIWSNTSQG